MNSILLLRYLLIGTTIWAALIFHPRSIAAEFQPAEPITGSLTIVGSDTMAELIRSWSDQLMLHHPSMHIQLHAAGSGTAPPALIRGTTSVGAMSRPMSNTERQEFINAYGYPPVELTVALDAIAIVVNHNNPLEELSLLNVAGIFAATQTCQAAGTAIDSWQALFELEPEYTPGRHSLTGRSIQRFGRNAASGTYSWFRQHALCGADYLATVNSLPGNGAVVTAVQQTANGIGYIGIAFLTEDVKALALVTDTGISIAPALDSIRDGEYPFTRRLFLYINRPPGRRFTTEVQELLKLIYSGTGQATVSRVGLIALSEQLTQEAIADHQLN